MWSPTVWTADGQNPGIVSGDLAKSLSEIEARDGGEVTMFGTGSTAPWLLREGTLGVLHTCSSIQPWSVMAGLD